MTAIAGLGGQLVGNVTFQWGLGQVGLALTASLNLGGMIVAAAILGRIFLHEPVTPRAAISLGLLVMAIAVLSLGAADAHQSVTAIAPSRAQIVLGVGAGCLSGLAYAILNVVIRYGVVRGMPLPTTLFVVSGAGLLSLGTLSWLRLGSAGMTATQPDDLSMMLLAGVCNALAFLALTKSLQLTSVVYVNALNATQASLAALAGVLIFQEALSPWLLAGVALTMAGLLLLTRTRQSVAVPET
jgi:drug/metabolite transporter (DMT)-like permease